MVSAHDRIFSGLPVMDQFSDRERGVAVHDLADCSGGAIAPPGSRLS